MPHPSPARRLAAITLGALTLAAAACHAADLTVEVRGARSTEGTVNVALYTSADAWKKMTGMAQGQRAPAAQPVTVVVFKDIAPGRYALSAYHDDNGNGKVDTNVVGVPTERTGFSRDARGQMGPPTFDDAMIDVQGDMTTSITLR
ncbi:MAG: DUF2141 domain-containing protein [Proteobacteria bacterium]|nr:DUF2141 domain-containing protein [Pseudomonadota bacterium]